MEKIESAKRVLSASLVMDLGAGMINAETADAQTSQPVSNYHFNMDCRVVPPRYEMLIKPNSFLFTPEPGFNKQYYLLIAEGNRSDILQKDLQKQATERSQELYFPKTIKSRPNIVSFKDAANNVFMEFKAELMKSNVKGQHAGVVIPLACKRVEQTGK